MRQKPTFYAFLPLIIFFLLVGWGGLILLMTLFPPTIWNRVLFYMMVVMAFTGTALPVVVFLQLRYLYHPTADANVIVRQAMWVGVFMAFLAWLRNGEVLNGMLAAIVFVALVGIELGLRFWERSQWRPERESRGYKDS